MATENSIVVGDVHDSQINIGFAAQDLQQRFMLPIQNQLSQIADAVAREKGLDENALRAILAKFEDKPVRRDEIISRLSNAVEQLIELKADLPNRISGNPDIDGARTQAAKELSLNQFDLALETLERGRLSAAKLVENGRKTEASFLEDQAKIDILKFSYRAAADKYRRAAELVSNDRKASFDFLAKRATALQDLGELFGDDKALAEAIEQWEHAGALVRYEENPKEHRKAYNNLATALDALGQRQPTNELLDRAAAIQREIISEEASTSDSFYRTGAQANLGSTLMVLGQRKGDASILLEAVRHLETAVKSIDRNSRKSDWVGLKSNIGNGYKLIGEITRDAEKIDIAVELHKEAISTIDICIETQDWIRTTTNLGAALTSKGQLLRSSSILSEAVKQLEAAASKTDKNFSSSQWSNTNYNLATALTSLGIETNEIFHFQRALEVKLSIFTASVWDEKTLPFAYSAWGVGMAYYQIALRTYDTELAKESVRHLGLANSIIRKSVDERSKPGIGGALQDAINLQIRLSAY